MKNWEGNSMVEWKKLDNCLRFEQPTPYLVKSTEYDDLYKTPVLTAGQSLLLGYTNETDGIFKASKENPCIIFDDFTTSFHWIDFDFKVKSSAMKMLRPKNDVNFRYVYYAMLGINFVPGGHQRHWISKYSQFEIPIPSLEEQQRIVGILDTFTASIDNLKEQIAQRRKQYEYYRDQLLDLEGKEGVEMKNLGELSELVTKQTGFDYSSKIKPELIKKKEKGSIPFLQTRNFNGRNFNFETEYFVPNYVVKQFPKITLDKECILLSIVGASIGNVGLFPGSPKCFLGGAICVIKFKEEILVPYIYEIMSSWYGQRLIQSKIKGAGQATITVDDIRHFMIPLPSLPDQQRIVSILDAFEASIANLEAQLKEREKQYEYYRNKLLTFE